MFGYYGAAYIVDSRFYGRRRLQVCWVHTVLVCMPYHDKRAPRNTQMVGFLVLFVCYLITACLYPTLTEPRMLF